MSIYSEHAQNVNRIRREIAQIEADSIRRKGDFWGGTLQMLGQLPLQILNERDARRAADDKAAMDAEELRLRRRNLDLQGEKLEDERAERTSKREREQAIANAPSPFDVANVIGRTDPKAANELHNNNRQTAARMLLGANANNLDALKKSVTRLVGEEEAALLPATYDKDAIQGVARAWLANPGDLFKAETEGYTLTPGAKRFGANNQEVASVPPIERPAAEGGFTLSPGSTRYDAQGKEIASVPDRPPAASTSKFWVMRNGKALRISDSEYQPGDLPASTREQGRNVTSGDVSKITDLDASLSDLNVLDQAISGVAGATGTTAAIQAGLPNWATSLLGGWGTDAKKKQAVIDRVKQVIGKALEGGVLRKEDEVKYEKILPIISDGPDVVKSKLAGLKQAIGARREQFLSNLEDANYDVSRYRGRAPGNGQSFRVGGYTVEVEP